MHRNLGFKTGFVAVLLMVGCVAFSTEGPGMFQPGTYSATETQTKLQEQKRIEKCASKLKSQRMQ